MVIRKVKDLQRQWRAAAAALARITGSLASSTSCSILRHTLQPNRSNDIDKTKPYIHKARLECIIKMRSLVQTAPISYSTALQREAGCKRWLATDA